MKTNCRSAPFVSLSAGAILPRKIIAFLTLLIMSGLVCGQIPGAENAAAVLSKLRDDPFNPVVLNALLQAQKSVADKSARIHYIKVCYLGRLALGDVQGATDIKRLFWAVDPANSCWHAYPVESVYADCSFCGGAGKKEGVCTQCRGTRKCHVCKGSKVIHGVSEDQRCICGDGRCIKCAGTGKITLACNKCFGTGKVLKTNRVTQAYLQELTRNLAAPSVGEASDQSDVAIAGPAVSFGASPVSSNAVEADRQTQGPDGRPLVYPTIHLAAANGDLADVKNHLQAGAEVNAIDRTRSNQGMTPLMFAAEKGHLDVVKYLLANGADVTARARGAKTALIFAVNRNKGQQDVITLLLDHGADVNARDRDDGTPLLKAAEYGNFEIVQCLVEKGADVNAKGKKQGATPIREAARAGKLEIVAYLVTKGADVNVQDAKGVTPLIAAVHRPANLEVVEYLVGRGADINLGDNDGNTPLITAANKGNLAVVEYLVKKNAAVNASNRKGRTALMVAVPHLDIVKFLVANDADVSAKDAMGRTALNVAAQEGRKDAVEFLKSRVPK